MEKDPNYLADLTWPEVQAALQRTDLAIIPVGSVEQHGHHLPLGTDFIGAMSLARAAAKRTGAIVAPAIFPGISEHHMAFPGTLTLSAETFVRVLMEVAQSLIRHGFRKILLVNGHGGNETTMRYVADRINRETEAMAAVFGIQELRKVYLTDRADKMDVHAGYGETAIVMHLAGQLIDRQRIRKPTMRLGPNRARTLSKVKDDATWFPFAMLKLPATHTVTDTGSITFLDPKDATPDVGRQMFEKFVDELVAFVERWQAAYPPAERPVRRVLPRPARPGEKKDKGGAR
ncbi:MAG: creatininase family protein [Armatimonadetes bacterium]|nr:creatininase family protein [Armatimonadota bacterium]